MKDFVKINAIKGQAVSPEQIRAAVIHIITAVCAFISSRAVISGKIVPFGLSITAGVPISLTPTAAIGAFAGYFFPAIGSGGFRYTAEILAVVGIKLLLSQYKKLIENPLFLSALCFLSTGITAIITFFGMSADIIPLFSETVVATFGTYFFARSAKALQKEPIGMSGDELAAFLISLNILIAGVDTVSPDSFSLAKILGILLILICAKYGGTLSGAISGIAFSVTSVLTGIESQNAAVFAFSGLTAGIFSVYGKYIEVTSMIVSSVIGIAVMPFDAQSVMRIIETMTACVLFLLIPRNAGALLGKLFCIKPQIFTLDGVKKAVVMRLGLAANALSDVQETVEQVSRELSKINSPDFGTVLQGIENDACKGCKLRMHCWESRKSSTVDAVLAMTKAVKSANPNPQNAAEPEFRGRCLRLEKLSDSVKKNYTEFASKTAAENRIEEVREVVSDQFNGISNMLYDLSIDINREEQFDYSTAVNAALALKNINIHSCESSCSIDKFSRMTLKFKVRRTNDLILNKRHIMKAVSLVCERNFDIPNISEVGNDIFITLSERAALRVEIGVHQINSNYSNICGDAFNYFNDGQGHFMMILSDGMGTGGRAAVDGAMASGLMSRLLKAGFGYNCSLKILNSSMLFKSTDESMATVDIASIDLYTGDTVLHKAGAASTVVRRSGRVGKAESSSLPVGILRDVKFDKAGIKLRVNDILLMMSDGVTDSGTEWIKEELEKWQDGTAQQLAEHICDFAKRRSPEKHQDDITVMAAIIHKAL